MIPYLRRSKNIVLYRALRTDELNPTHQHLLPPCTPCPEAGACCDISPQAHVRAGTKAKVKSRWISATKSQLRAALWASNTTAHGTPTKLSSAHYVSFELNLDRNKVIDLTVPPKELTINLKASALKSAQRSQEVLIKDRVNDRDLIGLYHVVRIKTKKEWEDVKINPNTQQKFTGRRKAKDPYDIYVISTLIRSFPRHHYIDIQGTGTPLHYQKLGYTTDEYLIPPSMLLENKLERKRRKKQAKQLTKRIAKKLMPPSTLKIYKSHKRSLKKIRRKSTRKSLKKTKHKSKKKSTKQRKSSKRKSRSISPRRLRSSRRRSRSRSPIKLKSRSRSPRRRSRSRSRSRSPRRLKSRSRSPRRRSRSKSK